MNLKKGSKEKINHVDNSGIINYKKSYLLDITMTQKHLKNFTLIQYMSLFSSIKLGG